MNPYLDSLKKRPLSSLTPTQRRYLLEDAKRELFTERGQIVIPGFITTSQTNTLEQSGAFKISLELLKKANLLPDERFHGRPGSMHFDCNLPIEYKLSKEEPMTKKFWTVVNFNSTHWQTNQLTQHATKADAIKKAKELAGKYNHQYVVLQAIAVCEQRTPPVGYTQLR